MSTRSLIRPEPSITSKQRVEFPTIADAFGTADLIVRIGNVIHVVDFKFGTGVRVLALYPDGDEDVINAQLLFYAAAARHSFPEFFAGVEDIVLTILQPMSIELDAEMVSTVTVTPAELDAFITLYRAACAEALADRRRAWSGAPIAASVRPGRSARRTPVRCSISPNSPCRRPRRPTTLPLLAAGLDLVDAVKDLGTALRDQAKQALQNGDVVPGYTLSAGRAVRHWHDEAAAAVKLINLGLARDDVLVETLRSPKQVEIRAKARGLKIPTEMIVSRSLRRVAGAERKRTRSGARTERDRAVFLRGTLSLPGRRHSND